jgi:hypothetical protein
LPTRHTLLATVLATLLFAAAGLAARDTNAGTAAPTTTTTPSTTVASTTTTTVDPTAFARWIEASVRTTTTTTLPAPVAAAPAAPTTSGCAYEAQIRAAFPGDGDWAVMVAWRESRCQPGAVNWAESCGSGSHAHGLFQMCFPMHLPTFRAVGCTDPLSAECNIRAAAHLYAGAGRSPWRMG